MSFSYGFYNSLYGDRKYNAIQISQIFDGIINDGIYATIGNCMMVRESEQPNKLIIGSGRGWFNHTWNYNDADSLLNCEISDLVYPRIDVVVLDINRNEKIRENSIKYIMGTANENPVKPTLVNSDGHFQYPLAYITREPNTETIPQANIENTVGTSECPFVTGIIETVNTDELIAQWQAQWNDFVITSEEDFLTWFNGIKDILDENAAAHLQSEIDNLNISITDISNKLTITRAILPAGETTITISDSRITTDSAFSFYSGIRGVDPTEVSVEAGLVTLTFDAQETDMEVGVRVDG